MLEAYLSDENYDLFSVQNALDGIKHLQSGHKVDAILVDRMMPGMDGIEFIRQIKPFKNIPIIMQTAAASQDEIAEGIAEGVFYYLTKPYKKILLLSILTHSNELILSSLRFAICLSHQNRFLQYYFQK